MRYNTDNPEDVRKLLKIGPQTLDGTPQALPRKSIYGTPEAERMGLVPLLDYPDDLVEPADFKEVILHCRDRKIFPLYHQAASGVFDDGWDQDGYGYCWAFGATASLMGCRALEGQKPVRLNPFSLGWLVNWRNAGYYLDSTIKGMRERGVASEEYTPVQAPRPSSFKDGWEQDALNYRTSEWWDTRYQSEVYMLRQTLTILRTGVAGYIAYNWWNHALELVGLQWDESERNNVVVEAMNSHRDGVIFLTGGRAIPDELYGPRASSLPRQAA